MARCMPGCIAFPAGSASPTCSPARCSPRWPVRRPRPARRSARPAFRRCASAAIRRGFAAGIIAAGGTLGILLPPSITMILYAVAAEQSLGRLFLAGIGPGLLLVALFAVYAMLRFRREYRRDRRRALRAHGAHVGAPARRRVHDARTSSRCCRACCRSSSC